MERFNDWGNVLNIANLEPTGYKQKVSDNDLLVEIERIWVKLGRQPATNDIRKGISNFSLNTFSRHFGSWRNSLEVFIKYINENTNELDKNEIATKEILTKEIEPEETIKIVKRHRTTRDINLRLRFKVFQRDNFKCKICGKSPANNSEVILHVDHIIPWSIGGETEIENLQTLCSKCNLGKSNIN